MKVIIHDLREGEALSQEKSDKDSVVIHANNQYAPCCGCFKCWLKNAGFCIMKDSLQHIGALIGQSDPLIIVSQCCYGGYSLSLIHIFFSIMVATIVWIPHIKPF